MTTVAANTPWLQSNDWPNRNLHNTWRSVGHLLLRTSLPYQTAKLSQLRVQGIPSCNWIVSEFRPGFHLLIGESSAKPLAELDHTTFLPPPSLPRAIVIIIVVHLRLFEGGGFIDVSKFGPPGLLGLRGVGGFTAGPWLMTKRWPSVIDRG